MLSQLCGLLFLLLFFGRSFFIVTLFKHLANHVDSHVLFEGLTLARFRNLRLFLFRFFLLRLLFLRFFLLGLFFLGLFLLRFFFLWLLLGFLKLLALFIMLRIGLKWLTFILLGRLFRLFLPLLGLGELLAFLVGFRVFLIWCALILFFGCCRVGRLWLIELLTLLVNIGCAHIWGTVIILFSSWLFGFLGSFLFFGLATLCWSFFGSFLWLLLCRLLLVSLRFFFLFDAVLVD